VYTERDLFVIANLTASYKIDGHRADLVILKTARALAAFENRGQISERDILMAAQLALPHRMKRNPFDDAGLNDATLEQKMEQVMAQAEGEEGQPQASQDSAQMQKKKMTT
jgi:Mg-chelatase subunit ChlI